jgi:hypothetical protein
MNLALLRVDAMNKPSLLSESGAETQVNIHTIGENLTTQHTYDSKILHVATIHDDNQGVGPGSPHPSARLPCDTSPGCQWMAHTLSWFTSLQVDSIASDSATNKATKFRGPHKSCMR